MKAKANKAARARAQRLALRRELERVSEIVERKTREAIAVLDESARGAEAAVILEGRVEGDTIVVDEPPASGI